MKRLTREHKSRIGETILANSYEELMKKKGLPLGDAKEDRGGTDSMRIAKYDSILSKAGKKK